MKQKQGPDNDQSVLDKVRTTGDVDSNMRKVAEKVESTLLERDDAAKLVLTRLLWLHENNSKIFEQLKKTYSTPEDLDINPEDEDDQTPKDEIHESSNQQSLFPEEKKDPTIPNERIDIFISPERGPILPEEEMVAQKYKKIFDLIEGKQSPTTDEILKLFNEMPLNRMDELYAFKGMTAQHTPPTPNEVAEWILRHQKEPKQDEFYVQYMQGIKNAIEAFYADTRRPGNGNLSSFVIRAENAYNNITTEGTDIQLPNKYATPDKI